MNRIVRTLFLILALGVLGIATSGCHSRRHTVRGHQAHNVSSRVEPSRDEPAAKGDAKKVIAESRRWLGTPYKYGGQDRKGMDCSGMVQTVFNNALGMKLPRTSRDMAAQSKRISRKELRPADLVFFVSQQGGSRINHVAIYVGNGRIIHSTTSRGVIESDLDEGYWKTHYYCSGRVL